MQMDQVEYPITPLRRAACIHKILFINPCRYVHMDACLYTAHMHAYMGTGLVRSNKESVTQNHVIILYSYIIILCIYSQCMYILCHNCEVGMLP